MNSNRAIRYGSLIGEYVDSAIPAMVSFVLGSDVETSVTIENEHMLDVVLPLRDEWDLEGGMQKAPIMVFIPGRVERLRMELGDILINLNGRQGTWAVVKNLDYNHAETVTKTTTIEQDLASVLNRHNTDSRVGIPDFILGDFLSHTLNNIHVLTAENNAWRRGSK